MNLDATSTGNEVTSSCDEQGCKSSIFLFKISHWSIMDRVIVDIIKTGDRKIITTTSYNKNKIKYKLIEYVEEYIRREGLAIGRSGRSYMVWENGNIR